MASATSNKKTGRKKKHHVAANGETIVGLQRKGDGRWRIIGTWIQFTEPDEATAIARFRRWERSQSKEVVKIPHLRKENGQRIPAVVNGWIRDFVKDGSHPDTTDQKLNEDGTVEYRSEVPGEAFWEMVRKLLLSSPELIAEKTGVKAVARLPELMKDQLPSPTIEAVGEVYFTKAKITPHELSKSKAHWKEFASFLAARNITTLRQIETADVADWYDKVVGADKKPTYAKHRFGKVKTILNFARTRGLLAADCRKALDSCAVLVAPSSSINDPTPIEVEDFRKLLAIANEKMQAILLTALNACMYASEVAMLDWSEIDLDKATIVTERNKTGVSRVAVLWPRTIEALKRLDHKKPWPFVAAQGKRMNANIIGKLFDDLRTKAKVNNEVTFRWIRDGAYTAAVSCEGVQFQTAQALGGHRCGMADKYVRRNPKMVSGACEAVRAAYLL